MTPRSLLWPGFCLVLCIASPTGATTIYRSVDADGVVTFTDVPPEDGADVETLHIRTPPTQPDNMQQQRLEDMRATTDRMVADRRAREEHRAQMRELRTRNQPPQYTVDYTPAPFYGGSRFVSRYYPPFIGLPPGHKPGHPGLRPPLRPRPEQPIIRPGNNYPASLVRRHYQPAVRQAIGR